MWQYFKGSTIVAAIGFLILGVFGFLTNQPSMVFSGVILALIEIAVSADNAVINAKILGSMDEFYRRLFITLGIFIAVFVVRLVFPLLIVSFAGGISMLEAIHLAWADHTKYEEIVKSAHPQIAAFGGVFLSLVATTYFFNAEKEHHWLPFSRLTAVIGRHPEVRLILPISSILVIAPFTHDPGVFFQYGMYGLISFLLIEGLGDLFAHFEPAEASSTVAAAPSKFKMIVARLIGCKNLPSQVAKTGFAGFMYLEAIDFSFSIDGVVAAFAITNDFIVIMIGLGVGAMFVRSLTLYMVDHEVLNKFIHLEDGAFYGIAFLAVTMLLGAVGIEFHEMIIAGGTILTIIAAIVTSLRSSEQGHQ